MSSLNTNEEYPQPKKLLAPLPTTQRGFGIHIDATLKGSPRLVYANGRQVVIRSLEDPSNATFCNAHKANVNVAKFSPNGEWIASGDSTGILKLWGAKNQVVKNEVRVCSNVLDIAWSHDNQRLVAGGDGFDVFAKVFMWNSANTIGQIGNFSKKVLSLDYKPSRPFRIAACNEEKQVNFYEGPPFKFKQSDVTHTNYPNCLRYSPDGSQFVTCGSDRKIIFFDGKTGDKVKEWDSKEDGHEGSIYSISWSPDGTELLTASGDRTCKIWDAESGAVKTTFTFGDDIKDFQVACLWIEGYMLSVSLSGSINFLDRDNPAKPKQVVQGHQTQINSIDTDSQGNIFTGDNSGNLGVFEEKSGEGTIFSGDGHGDTVIHRVALSCDGKKLYSVGFDDKLYSSDVDSRKTGDSYEELEGQPTDLASGNTDPELAAVTTTRNILYILKGGRIQNKIALSYKGTACSFSPDDSELTVGGEDKKLHVYDVSAYGATEKYELVHAQCAVVTTVTYSRDATYITCGDTDRHTYLWEREGSHEKPKNPTGWKYHGARVTGADWTLDGVKLVTGSADEQFIVWPEASNGKNKKRKKTEHAHFGGILDLKVLNENTLVTCGDDRAVKLWDLE